MRTFNITLTKSPKGNWYSTVRSVLTRKVVCLTKTKGLKGHVENLKNEIFRELVSSRETLKLKES